MVFVLLTREPTFYPPDLSSLTTRGRTPGFSAQAFPAGLESKFFGEEVSKAQERLLLEEKMRVFKVWSMGCAVLFSQAELDSVGMEPGNFMLNNAYSHSPLPCGQDCIHTTWSQQSFRAP